MNNVDSYINNENYNNVSQLKCKPTFTNLPNTFRSVCLDLKYVKYGEIWRNMGHGLSIIINKQKRLGGKVFR